MSDISKGYVKFLKGTPTAYNNLRTKDKDTFYFVCEKDATVGKLYLGNILVTNATNPEGIVDYLSELKDVDTSGVENKNVLGYDAKKQKWVPMSFEEAQKISVMQGATNITDGIEGLVPAPKAGQENLFLRGDGQWSSVDSLKEIQANDIIGLSEWIADNQDNINGLYPTDDALKLSQIEDGAQVNTINEVSSDFIITENKALQLNTLPPSKIEGLTQNIEKINILQIQVNNLVENSQGIADLKSVVNQLSQEKIPYIETKITNLEEALNKEKIEIQLIKQNLVEVPNKYVSKVDFNAVVGD